MLNFDILTGVKNITGDFRNFGLVLFVYTTAAVAFFVGKQNRPTLVKPPQFVF